MEANELRIGNYVIERGYDYNHDNKFPDPLGDEVVQVDINLLVEIEKNPEDYKPIELSPEILEAVGFEQADSSHLSPDTFVYKKGNFIMLRQTLKLAFSEKNDDYFFLFGDLSIKVNSLHQLQNLWHSLTGTELTLNTLIK